MSELASFLDRMIAPGNFICVAYKAANGMRQSFFPRDQVDDAAEFLTTQSNAGHDTWFAPASFITKKRSQATAQALKAFWFDADILRPGDGKDATKAFADEAELKRWVASFCRTTGVPLPNVWVKSG